MTRRTGAAAADGLLTPVGDAAARRTPPGLATAVVSADGAAEFVTSGLADIGTGGLLDLGRRGPAGCPAGVHRAIRGTVTTERGRVRHVMVIRALAGLWSCRSAAQRVARTGPRTLLRRSVSCETWRER